MPRYSDLKPDGRTPLFFHYKGFGRGYELVVCVPSNIRFQCIKCGDCCQVNAPPLSTRDIKRLIEAGKTNFMEERDPETLASVSLIGYYLKRNKAGHCWFFDDKKNRCKVYNDRPDICRTYPMEFNAEGTKSMKRATLTYMIDDTKEEGKTLCRGFTQEKPQKSDFIPFLEAARRRYDDAMDYARRIASKVKLDSKIRQRMTKGFGA